MPIGKDEWDAGRTWETLEARILTFLRNNRNKGFTISEIMKGIEYETELRARADIWGLIGGIVSVWSVRAALETLVKEGTVRAKIVKKAIGEDTYYMAT